MNDVRIIGLLCLAAGAILFVRQLWRLKKGKTTKCNCGNLFPSKPDDKDNIEKK